MWWSIEFLPMGICLQERSLSLVTYLEPLKAGLSATKPSSLVRPKASSAVTLLSSAAVAHPSSVKYESSMYSKFFSLLSAKGDGQGMITLSAMRSSSKSLIFGFFFSTSFLSASASFSSSACLASSSCLRCWACRASASYSSLTRSSHAAMRICLSALYAV